MSCEHLPGVLGDYQCETCQLRSALTNAESRIRELERQSKAENSVLKAMADVEKIWLEECAVYDGPMAPPARRELERRRLCGL